MMKVYRGHKEVYATPMSLGKYRAYRGWVIPKDENPDDPGYLVVYNRNTADHYESWSPKHIFDAGYFEIGTGMAFAEAFNHMMDGQAIALRVWGGYWRWDAEKQTVMMHLYDGAIQDMRDSSDMSFTLFNVFSEDWEVIEDVTQTDHFKARASA